MKSIGHLVGAALAIVAVSALAQSPYVINGLHTDLLFTAAVARAEKLSGNCQITPSATQDGGTSALCEYVPCSARNQDGACKPQDAKMAGLTIASQPIRRIGLEAPTDSAQLTQIVVEFEGDSVAVEDNLRQAYGPPTSDRTATNQGSWSHSRRLSWTQGAYRMGLMDSPKLIILAVDPTQK